MAISAGAIWRVRIGGSDTLCSGLFDPTIAGAGTDYTEQDTAQLALTDLASSTPYTTITSATGGFTAAMIGNGIYIASGTGFTAGRYVITAVTDTNTAVVDRACAASAASAGVAKLGGAMNSMLAVAAVKVSGNTLFVRGQGSNDPVDIDYYNSGYSAFDNLTIIGYNGRPKISHSGIFINGFSGGYASNLYFIQTSSSYSTYGAIVGAGCFAENCVFDSGGFDGSQVRGCSLYRCSVINTGSQLNGTRGAIWGGTADGVAMVIDSCVIKDQRAAGISGDSRFFKVINSVIQNNKGNGIELTGAPSGGYSGMYPVQNCTIYNNGGHGITISHPDIVIKNNIISDHQGAGAFGVYWAVNPNTLGFAYSLGRISGNNFFGNLNNSNYPLPLLETTLDPQFANAPVDLTPTNPALRLIGGVGAL